ncbi:MAG TPA: glycerophosphoryl diester phosphodiesterase membrane domain-containing protein [Terriglobales bacterium]|nr:glycerophosphoryl diester phosphodiesterase membrane domain-containing protein [Terriglobales bacterium]
MPGVVLQPLNLGELLDRMFSLYRKNFLLFFGIMLLPSLLAMASGILMAVFRSPMVTSKAGTPVVNPAIIASAMGGFVVAMVAYWIVYAIALGASTFAVSDVYLGRTATIAASYRRIRGRIWRLFWLMFLVSLRVFGVFMLLMLGLALFIPLLGGRGSAAGIVIALMMLVLFPVAFGLSIWLMLRYSVCIPSMVLEDLHAGQAIRRSAQLMKGNYLRCFLLLMLTVVITYVSLTIFQGPFYIAMILTARHGQIAIWLLSLSSVFGALGGALSAPLIMIGLVLLYYDIRVRKEAFDLQLMMSLVDHGGAQPAPGAAAVAPSA